MANSAHAESAVYALMTKSEITRPEHSIHTYADSGASDHCFVNKSDFYSYKLFNTPKEGQAAGEDLRFAILGQGIVKKTFLGLNGQQNYITFNHALHTPNLAANFISISQIDAAGHKSTFGDGQVTIKDKEGRTILSGKGSHGMYLLQIIKTHITMPAQVHKKPVTIEVWH